jgi:hypothetical protein
VFNFTWWWKNLEGKLKIGDYWEMWMDAVHRDSFQAISRAAAEALTHLPDDYAVVQTSRDLITAGQMRQLIQLQAAQ